MCGMGGRLDLEGLTMRASIRILVVSLTAISLAGLTTSPIA